MSNITKNEAVRLIRNSGVNIDGRSTTFASQNKGLDTYWANPRFKALKADWWIILNDRDRQTLHVFLIPRKTFDEHELVARGDKPDFIDIQIDYHSPNFMDKRSKKHLKNFLIKTIQYGGSQKGMTSLKSSIKKQFLQNDQNFDQLKIEFGNWLDEYDILSSKNSIASYRSYVNQLRNGYNDVFGVGKFETIVSVYQSKSEKAILKFYTNIIHFINDQKRKQKKKWTDIGSGFYQFDEFLRDKFDCDDLESGKVKEITYKNIETVIEKPKAEEISEKEIKIECSDISEEFTQKELMRTFKNRLKTQSRYYPQIDMLFPARLINDVFHKNKDKAFDVWMQNGLANMHVLSKDSAYHFSAVSKICLRKDKRVIVVLDNGYKFELYTYKGDGKTKAPLRTLDKRDISVDHIISLAEKMQQNKSNLPAFKEMTKLFNEYKKQLKVKLNPRADRTWKDNLLHKYSRELNSSKMRSAIMADLKRMDLQYILMDQRENSKKGKK